VISGAWKPGNIIWFDINGQEMTDEIWNASWVKCLGVLLAGDTIQETDEYGERIIGDTLLLLLNSSHEDIVFTLPVYREDMEWELILDTFDLHAEPVILAGLKCYNLRSRSLSVFALIQKPTQNGEK